VEKQILQNELADPTVSQGLSSFESVLHQVKTSRQAARCSIRRQISSGLWEDRCPVGTLKEVLVEKLAVNLWRLRRLIIADSPPANWGADTLGFPSVDRFLILRYESNLLRDIDRTLGQLERFQRIELDVSSSPKRLG
jgi:hypothetical protein